MIAASIALSAAVSSSGAFPEVEIRGIRDPVACVPEVDGVQVHFQDLVFAVFLLQFSREFDLAQFAADRPFGDSCVFFTSCWLIVEAPCLNAPACKFFRKARAIPL